MELKYNIIALNEVSELYSLMGIKREEKIQNFVKKNLELFCKFTKHLTERDRTLGL